MLTYPEMSTELPKTSKSLGQHLLVDSNYCRKIARFAEIGPEAQVVEIGPGTGQLTRFLLASAAEVIALEFDRKMVDHLNQTLVPEHSGRLKVIQANVLRFDWASILSEKPFQVIGNLPYNIGTRILRQMIPLADHVKDCTFLLQKEVAARIVANPCSKDYGFLTLLIQYHFQSLAGFDVPPGVFAPRPKVVSQIIKLIPRPPVTPCTDYPHLIRLLTKAFQQRRKTLWNNLKGSYDLDRLEPAFSICQIPAKSRPEEITLAQYVKLVEVL